MDTKELLDKYVNRELNANEEEQLKILIKEDPEFRKAFVREKAMEAAVKARKKAELRKELRSMVKTARANQKTEQKETEEQQPKKAKVISLQRKRIVMAIAASVTLLMVSYFAFMNQATDYDSLYADNYRVYRYGLQMNRGDEGAARAGESAYMEGDYQKAIPLFNEALKKTDQELDSIGFSKDMLNVYMGNAYMNTGDYQNAVDVFEKVLKNNESSFKQDASWYLALSYLKLGEKVKAKALLQQISNTKSIYTKDAQKLVEAL